MVEKVENNLPIKKDQNLYIIFSVTLMAVLGVSSLTPVLPQVIEVFGIRRQEVTWLITAFTLPGVFLTPVFGILADRWGRKRMLVPSLLLFGFAGAACGFTRDFNLLIALRFIQGIGAAVLGTMAITLIGDLYPGRQSIKVMGWNASVLSVATATYPALGGFLAKIQWNLPFFLPVIALPIGFWVLFALKNPEPNITHTFKGYLQGALSGMFSGRIILLLALGLITFILLFGALLTFFPLWMVDRFQADPVLIGGMLALSSFASAVTSWNLGWINRHISTGVLILTGFLLYTVSLNLIPISQTIYFLILPALLYGFAQATNIPSLQSLIARAAPLDFRGAYMSANATVFRLGQTLGPPLAALAYTWFGIDGMFRAFSVLALVSLISLIVWHKHLTQLGRRGDKIN